MTSTTSGATRTVVLVAFDGMQSLDLVGPTEVFSGANAVLESEGRPPAYELRVISITGGPIRTESAIRLDTEPADSLPADLDLHTLVVPGGTGARAAVAGHPLTELVAALGARAERVLSVCSGAFVVANAGLATGKRMATHWARADSLQRRFPEVSVDADAIYVRDGNLWSSAGVTAGIDLALAVVEHDLDAEVAQTIARWLVMFLRRPGGQSQFAAPVWSERATTAPVRAAQELIEAAPADDHRLPVLAERVGMSERHLIRRFQAETGTTPARYVAAIRLDSARRLLETTTDTVAAIARGTGFGSAESLRRTFARDLGVSPDHYRRRFRSIP